jgi:acyl-CoA synthetase (NDP forming)
MKTVAAKGPGTAGALDLIFKPAAIAIVGLSRKAIDAPISVLTNLKAFGYGGDVYIINPRLPTDAARKVYPSLGAVPAPIDLAIVSLGRDRVLGALEDCVDAGIRAAIVITQGFADADGKGARLQAEMVALTKTHDLRILGPNTIGVANAFADFTSSFLEVHNAKLSIGIIAQSGLFMMGHNIIGNEPAGFGMAADIGNACDIDLTDILDYYGEEDAIRVIQCHIEAIDRGGAFIEAAARISRSKPIIALKAGTSQAGQVAVASHSGAAAGEGQVYRAAFRKAGVIAAENAEELRILTKAFATYAPPKGTRVAVMSFSGAACILAIDAIEAAGLTLATFSEETREALAEMFPDWLEIGNPLDVWYAVSGDFHARYPRVLELLLMDAGVDAVFCLYPSFTLPKHDPYDSARHIRALAGRHPDTPVVCWSYGLDIAGFTKEIERDGTAMVFPGLDGAATTLAKLARYGAYQRTARPAATPRIEADRATVGGIIARAKGAGARHLFTEGLEILQAYGGNLAAWRVARDEEELVSMADGLGYPVCLKVISPDVIHKSDSGGIRLGIRDRATLVENYRGLLADVAARAPGAGIAGVLVQAMAPKGKEVMIGARKDPVFGHCLVLGAGGIYTEVLDDNAFRLAPIDEAEAHEMIAALRFAPILDGVRGEAASYKPSIVEALLQVSQLVADHPEIIELDINPLIVTDRDAVIVDARIIL